MAQTRIKGPARRERLLDAAAQIVLEHGVSAVTMEAVALLNGVNRAMAYRYFADRDDILSQLLDREYELQTRHVFEHVDAVADLEAAVRFALLHWFQHGDLFLKLANDTGPLAARAAAIRRADALHWAGAFEATFVLPHAVAMRLAAFVVSGAYGVFETRTGADDEIVIDNVVRSVMAAGEALRRKYASGEGDQR
jgi:AcrR family transcriptional regulator